MKGTSHVFVPHKLYAAHYEVPREEIWRHRMRENPLAAGTLPRTRLGSLQRSPKLIAGGEEGWLPASQNPTSPLLYASASPLGSGWRRPCQKLTRQKIWLAYQF